MARRREEESSLRGYEHEFLRAAEELKTAALHGDVVLSDAQKIKFYALFKQATDGDCAKPQPSAFKPVERAKWNGWQALRGMDVTVAKRRYVLQVIELVPSFRMPTERQGSDMEELNDAEAHRGEEMRAAPEEPVAPPVPTVVLEEEVPAPPPVEPTVIPEPPQAVSRPTRRRVPTDSTRHNAPLIRRQQRRTDVPAYSYSLILLEVLALALGVAILVIVGSKILVPACHRVAAEQFGFQDCNGLRSLAPVAWFVSGYMLVSILRSKMFEWRLLSGEFVWFSALSPLRRVRRFRRHRQQPSTEDEDKVKLLKELGIHLVKEPEGPQDRWATPRVELVLPSDPDALSFGNATAELPFSVEQTADVYYRKFKEPLPDPANHLLVGLVDEEEKHLEEYDAIYRRRLMRFRNATPYLIKRFVSSEYIDYVEHTLLDKRNQVFYVYIKNRSFESLGTIEDYSVYQAAHDRAGWTSLTQSARVRITSSSIGFFRSQVESFISTFYVKQAPLARQYHLQRLHEECGAPAGLPVPPSSAVLV